MEHHEFRRKEVSLSEMFSFSSQSHDAFIKGYSPSPHRNNPYVGRMNMALVTSAKENHGIHEKWPGEQPWSEQC